MSALSCPPGLTLLTGGARSGKSDLAQRLADGAASPVTVLATATAGDDDMAMRIARHRAERPAGWRTIEEPIDLIGALDAVAIDDCLVVDCLTLWTSNRLLSERGTATLAADADALAARCAGRVGPTIVVTNEVGSGVHPETELGRSYRDLLGIVNRQFAHRADRSWLVVAGQVLVLQRPEDLT